MLDSLQMMFERLLMEISTDFHRSLFYQFNLNNRLTGLTGARGVGKTTLLLQYIKMHYPKSKNIFYFSADHIYFKSVTVYEFVEELFLKQSIDTFFIDEIHKYSGEWSQELKNLYDGFPKIKIVFSGSSSLDLVKGSYDLSRRAKMYELPGLSFREYLEFSHGIKIPAFSFEHLMQNYMDISKDLSETQGLLGYYHDYLKQGYYPFVKEDPLSYYEKILAIVEKTIYEDIANFYNLKTGNLRQLSKILNFLATIPPGKISTYNLGNNLSIDDKTAANYLTLLNETGLVEIIYPAEPGSQGLRKPEKVFFNNTNLHYALSGHLVPLVDMGSIRELAFIQSTKNSGLEVYHDKSGDYQIKNFVYEIGGKNKTRKQVKGIEHAVLVKDDTLSAVKGMIPLFFFGFIY